MGAQAALRDGVITGVETLKETTSEVIDGSDTWEIITVFGVLPAILLAIEGIILSDFWVFSGVTRSVFWLDLVDQPLLSVETLVETYLSSFAHGNWAIHLKPNLTNYLLLMSALYPMAVLTRRKEKVAKIYITILLFSPLFITLMSFLYPMGTRSIGFSGVLSAYFGVLPVVMFAAVDARIDSDLNPFWSFIVMMVVYASIYVYLGSLIMAGVTTGLAVVGFIGMVFHTGVNTVRKGLRIVLGVDYFPFVWALLIAYGGTVAMYYNLPPGTNIVAHIAGYIFGFLTGFVFLGESITTDWMPYDWA